MKIPAAVDYAALKRTTSGTVRWVWEGYAAFGSITLFTSRWKSGKTTLLSVLLSRLHTGGTLAGAAVTAAPAVVVTEESPAIWVARGDKLAFGPNVKWICQPFLGKPSRDDWYALLTQIGAPNLRQPTLFVIDPLVMVLPGADENSARAIVNALAPLRALTQRGAAVLLLHHPRKGQALDPRGSGALSGFADILMELDVPPGSAPNDRRRWLRARGRHDVAPSERLIELVADGNDYTVRDPLVEECADGWQVIHWILSDAQSKKTRQAISDDWPEGRDKPHKATLCRWLQQAVDQGLIRCDGQGRRHNPFRYWLPEREKFFLPDLPALPDLGPVE